MALQARALAAADARQKAQHLAELHDTRLGRLRISESGVRGGRPQAMMMKAVSGMPNIMPRIPPRAVPQKNMATMTTTG